ncbi:MAG: sugar ABC transporter permease [Clostridiales bacterium]
MLTKKNVSNHKKAFWIFITPSAILFTIFFLVPLVLSIIFTFTNYDGWKNMEFVGLENYKNLFTDSDFYYSMAKTGMYTLFSLPFKVIIPLLIALLLTSKNVLGKSIMQTTIYIPVLLSALVVGITINWMFGQEYGLINFILENFNITPLEWALNSRLATFVISFASNWSSTGFFMIIFIGGINSISKDIYEAVCIDGANKFQTFFQITLPLLLPTTFMVILLSTVNLLKEYALVQGITQGGPGTSTTYIVQFIFSKGFDQSMYGYASTISIVTMVTFVLIAFIQFKVSRGGDIA